MYFYVIPIFRMDNINKIKLLFFKLAYCDLWLFNSINKKYLKEGQEWINLKKYV